MCHCNVIERVYLPANRTTINLSATNAKVSPLEVIASLNYFYGTDTEFWKMIYIKSRADNWNVEFTVGRVYRGQKV